MRANAFTLPYTFFRQDANEVLSELQAAGFTGINLALNYHASRDFLLRQGPQLEYLSDGFHYYLPDTSMYSRDAIRPSKTDHSPDNKMLEGVLTAAKKLGLDVNAWAVFMHNSGIGFVEPSATVENALGNKFLSELCPSNPRVAQYAYGLVADLSSRGIKSIAMESMHWHGARHGEHHERFFMELSEITEFLFSLCFCPSCIANFDRTGGNGAQLKEKVKQALQPFLTDKDPWLGQTVTKAALAEIVGAEILEYLKTREATLAAVYAEIFRIASDSGVEVSYVDQSTLLDMNSATPLDLSWLVGIDPKSIVNSLTAFEPLVYRKSPAEVAAIYKHYADRLQTRLKPILRPTFPDNTDEKTLCEKVAALAALGAADIDFYLLDTWRPRDLTWVANSLAN
ncbi:MAG: hypothetical protein RL031_662 [Actinomycetota bacterium]